MYPAQSPTIDWAYYSKNVSPKNVAALEKLKTSYEAFKIPYPADRYSALIDADKKRIEVNFSYLK